MSEGRARAVERLRHMVTAADTIAGYVGRGRGAFDTDPALRDAILYQIVVLGEAAKATLAADPALEGLFPGVEWRAMARMRDRVTHRYWATDAEVVWSTATRSVPELRQELLGALERLA
ncbi:MAG: HepT-like ribonuclease domain-containing protein [Gemmatimonadaceae bacterium]